MTCRLKSALAAVGLLLVSGAAAAQDQTIKLASLDWPPFSGGSLPERGAFISLISEALAGQGYKVEVSFLPWKRAVETALHDPNYVGLAPIYPDDLVDGLFGSKVVMSSPLGFAETAEKPLVWSTTADLKSLRLGVVMGYSNTPEFDAAVKDRRLTVDEVQDDVANLRKLAGGRIDAAVIDYYVMRHLLATTPELKPHQTRITFAAKPLGDKALLVGLRDTTQGRAVGAALERGLSVIDVKAALRRLLAS